MTLQPSPSLPSTRVAIVGAGPTGFLTAITLHKQHFTSITLIDRQQDPTSFHHNRAYTLCLYQLGQRLLQQIPDLFESLKQIALQQHIRQVTTISKHAISQTTTVSLPASPVYWLMRSDLLKLLAQYIKLNCPNVTLLTAHSVDDLVLSDLGHSLKLSSPTSGTTTLPADLVIACDGSHSRMRHLVAANQSSFISSHGFDLYSRTTPSVGMCPKGLLLSIPVISPPNAPKQLARPDMIYRFKGLSFDLLLLPVGSARQRIAMVCVKPTHNLWRAASAEDAFVLFERNFPQLRVRDMFSEEEMTRFASEKPMSFSPAERPMSLVGMSKSGNENSNALGVLFLGDAAHSFPPDTAQGVNSALEDVRVLKSVLEDVGGKGSLKHVLETYEKRRDGEIWQLMRLAEKSSPYQYEQNWVGYFGYMVNKTVRSMLSRFAPALFHPDADTLIRQNYEYSQVRQMSDSTTRNVVMLSLLFVALPLMNMLMS